ncbi:MULTISPECIES: hypothetical protein [unclassified Agarivorans]|uniref:hypothetical protein n=1 Tax=unclassified Agarivorans TaxID=2636026 RepID=UPI0026E1F22C|nr:MULTISPECIES: hypothetical protein [unclassified Agarivorans]MDO6684652.1 hypothetical protein [Agarivorans sp. 3_MG-2023]MDO6714817.1 hypothetical protein [Agarivorans sp. 2_MG-2023]
MNSHLIEVSEYQAAGYSPVVDFQTWRVAILNYIDELETPLINNFQCHLDTDEVFVLLAGRCILFCAETSKNRLGKIVAQDMQTGKIYNIKQGVYHTHTLSPDAKVLIVENSDTCDNNSPKISISKDIQDELTSLKAQLWSPQ